MSLTSPQSTIDWAVHLARQAHAGQIDKSGVPYITHPLRVMAAMDPYDYVGQVVALLHDVCESDAARPFTLAELEAHGCFPSVVLVRVDLLTKPAGMAYEQYIHRLSADAVSVRVKIADIRDNLDIRRLARLDETTRNRLTAKYLPALAKLHDVR